MMKFHLAFSLLAGLAANTWAADPIRFERVKDQLFVHAADVATKLDYAFKIVTPHRLATFCQDGEDGEVGLCIPVRLNGDNHRGDGEKTLIAASVLGKALRVTLTESDGRIVVTKQRKQTAEAADSPDTPAYNADWGKGRGFRVGQTVPDIPLVDLKGGEVRFSKFLGKRYILYVWASW